MESGDNMREKNLMKDYGLMVNHITLMPNKKIPHHKHKFTKCNYILKGRMSDEYGVYKEGDFLVNKKGSEHTLQAGPEGCEFLVIWNEKN